MIRDELVTQDDLIEAIQEALNRKGITSKLKSQLRAAVFHTLEDKTVISPEKPRDVFLASELLREFFMSFKLNNTLSVYSEEFGQPSEMRVDREFIAGELGLNVLECNNKIPLLMLMIQHLINNKTSVETNVLDSSLAVEADTSCDNLYCDTT